MGRIPMLIVGWVPMARATISGYPLRMNLEPILFVIGVFAVLTIWSSVNHRRHHHHHR